MHKNNVLDIMEKRNLSYRKLSQMSGVSYSTIYKIANYHEDPRQSTMIAISRALKLPVTDVFDLEWKKRY